MKKTKREFAPMKSSNPINSAISSNAAKTTVPFPANDVTPSQSAKNATPSSLDEAVATGAFNLQEAKESGQHV